MIGGCWHVLKQALVFLDSLFGRFRVNSSEMKLPFPGEVTVARKDRLTFLEGHRAFVRSLGLGTGYLLLRKDM